MVSLAASAKIGRTSAIKPYLTLPYLENKSTKVSCIFNYAISSEEVNKLEGEARDRIENTAIATAVQESFAMSAEAGHMIVATAAQESFAQSTMVGSDDAEFRVVGRFIAKYAIAVEETVAKSVNAMGRNSTESSVRRGKYEFVKWGRRGKSVKIRRGIHTLPTEVFKSHAREQSTKRGYYRKNAARDKHTAQINTEEQIVETKVGDHNTNKKTPGKQNPEEVEAVKEKNHPGKLEEAGKDTTNQVGLKKAVKENNPGKQIPVKKSAGRERHPGKQGPGKDTDGKECGEKQPIKEVAVYKYTVTKDMVEVLNTVHINNNMNRVGDKYTVTKDRVEVSNTVHINKVWDKYTICKDRVEVLSTKNMTEQSIVGSDIAKSAVGSCNAEHAVERMFAESTMWNIKVKTENSNPAEEDGGEVSHN